jgi:hypothetical protein
VNLGRRIADRAVLAEVPEIRPGPGGRRPSEPLATDVRELLVGDRYLDAVRLVRQRTHLNLMPAVLAVNAVRDRAGP